MATSHTQSHLAMPQHLMHGTKPRPHTHPLPTSTLLPQGQIVTDDDHQPPKSWHAKPQSSLAPMSMEERGHRSLPSNTMQTVTLPPQIGETSVATLENARYQLKDMPRSEHPNEDRHFQLELNNCKVFGVFDGHDGPRAAGFASNYFVEYFSTDSWQTLISLPPQVQKQQIPLALKEFFKAADKEFFKSIRSSIEERKQLQRTIPSHMTSYEAYLTYPVEVARLQELEPKIAGGTTVVLGVVCSNTLYIANTGDSRAVLVNENEMGVQQIVQLSVDHGVGNLDELKRLVDLGLNREQLQRSGRLGSQENTRSIGDYSIKEGYKDVDTLQQARGQPGLCEPHVEVVPLTPHCKYIILMTDGIYNSIESIFIEKAHIDSNKVLMGMVNHEQERLSSQKRQFRILADRVVDRIRAIHEDAHKTHASKDVRSPVAVACRKRDDVTLLVHQFERGPTSFV